MNQLNLTYENKKPSVVHYVGLFTIFCLGLFSVFPPIRALSFFNQLWALCILGWFFSVFISQPLYLLYPSRYRFVVYIYIIYTILISYIAGNGSIGNRFFELSQLPIFYLAFENNRRLGRNGDNIKILKWILPFLLFTCFQTLNAYRTNPYISRSLKSSQDLGGEYMIQGIGGYEFIYFLIFAVCILLYSFKSFLPQRRRKLAYAFYVVILIAFSANIFLSNFSTALFLLVLVFSLRLFGKKVNVFKLILMLFFSLFLYLIIEDVVIFIIDLYLSNFEGSINASRLLEIKGFLGDQATGVSIDARFSAFMESINTFFKNPIFGIIIAPLSMNSFGEVTGFGQHSQILDTFALFGAGVGLIQIYVYFHPFLQRMKIGNYSYNMMTITTMIVLLVVSLFNNVTPSIGLAAFFAFPTIIEFLNQKNDQE